MDRTLFDKTILVVAEFYDGCRVGYQGFEGYRKSSDLTKLGRCVAHLLAEGFVVPGRTIFTDLGCADGRVNVLMSYFVRQSVGIEIDAEILAEFPPRLAELKDGKKSYADPDEYAEPPKKERPSKKGVLGFMKR